MTDHRLVRLEAQIDDWQSRGVRWVRWELPDFHGTARTKLVPIGACRGYLERGLNMYGGAAVLDSRSDVVGGTVYNEETLYADQMLHPDPDSAALVPWRPDTARWICSARWANGSELEATPRQLLGRVLAVAGEMGYGIRTGAEYEFYVLDADKQPLFGGYHIFNPNRNSYHPVIDDILEKVQLAGIDLITASAEYGPSQFEVNFGPGDGLAGPDRSYTFKNAVKEICQQHGLHGTFMSKPITGAAGCGAHFHISLVDAGTGESVMGDDGDEHGITDTCRYFIGGNLRHAKAVYSLLSPTINCYRRRRPHLFAPTNISWGLQDRSALVRVTGASERSRHVEQRAPSGLSNPYLVAAGVLAAGLLGIRDRVDPGAPSSGVPAEDNPAYEPLPVDPRAALADLESSAPIRDLLGDDFITAWCGMRRYELQRFDDHVSDWERNEYIEIY